MAPSIKGSGLVAVKEGDGEIDSAKVRWMALAGPLLGLGELLLTIVKEALAKAAKHPGLTGVALDRRNLKVAGEVYD